MMHKHWTDLLPYYVAGTLSQKQAAELERHLAGCEDCRQTVREWQRVAEVVRSETQQWAAQTPQIPPQSVLTAAFSSNGRGTLPPTETSRMRLALSRSASARSTSIVTLAAVIAILLIGGVLLLSVLSDPDSPSQGAASRPTGTPTRPTLQAFTATPDSLHTPTFTPFGGAVNRSPTPTRGLFLNSPSPQTVYGPTPTARYNDSIGTGSYSLITLEQIDQIPANTAVRIDYAWYDGTEWIYAIMTANGYTMGYARDWQLRYVSGYTTPVATPTARYQDSIGVGGYSMITLEQVGPIPAEKRVRIGSAWLTESGWMYDIYAQDDVSAEAREDQITYAPGVTPGPTATSPFDSSYGYALITLEQVGPIPPDTRVSIGSAWYDRIDGWYYQIVTRNGQAATAHQSQIAYVPGMTPGPIPTSKYNNSPGGYPLVTLEQVGPIPPNTRVRISHSWYDAVDGWIFVVITQDEETSVEAYEYQLMYAPGVTPGPTPTARYMDIGFSGYPLTLLENVGTIRAGEPVRIGGGHYAALDGWTYTVVAQDEVRTAEVPERLVTLAGAKTPTPTSTACAYTTTLTGDCPQTQYQITAAYLPFERGFMLWRADTRQVYVLYSDTNTYDTFVDTWSEGETIPDDGRQPPAGTFRPQRGFGKIWAAQPAVRDRLGWATGAETGYSTLIEMHNFNIVLTLPGGQVLLLEELPPIWVLVP